MIPGRDSSKGKAIMAVQHREFGARSGLCVVVCFMAVDVRVLLAFFVLVMLNV